MRRPGFGPPVRDLVVVCALLALIRKENPKSMRIGGIRRAEPRAAELGARPAGRPDGAVRSCSRSYRGTGQSASWSMRLTSKQERRAEVQHADDPRERRDAHRPDPAVLEPRDRRLIDARPPGKLLLREPLGQATSPDSPSDRFEPQALCVRRVLPGPVPHDGKSAAGPFTATYRRIGEWCPRIGTHVLADRRVVPADRHPCAGGSAPLCWRIGAHVLADRRPCAGGSAPLCWRIGGRCRRIGAFPPDRRFVFRRCAWDVGMSQAGDPKARIRTSAHTSERAGVGAIGRNRVAARSRVGSAAHDRPAD